MKTKKGKFIVFGGLDETGKTTQSKRLAEWLMEQEIPVIWTKEPGGTPLGEKLKEILVENKVSAKTQLLLFQAAREEHLEIVIRPALEKGVWVVSDRFFESSYIYQGGMGLKDRIILESHLLFKQDTPTPSLTFLFTGKVGDRKEQNVLDAFCRSNRPALKERVLQFANLFDSEDSPHILLDVTNRTEEAIFQELIEEVKKRM
ncbi:dTMP kinase [Neobacillus sp. YIM B02564]|uniref:Thymidylate kinase n=1 Tax=Neobacillus paridis TaxID=2803862 RepID=A0ABS1TLD4_9BACI|nr:dTMP kinase [Neobacillus paridis]MBL4952105.1 dTMP kinase [Neobacillus paridis]